MADYSTNYTTDPWSGISSNQRTVYDPSLMEVYRRNTTYTDLIPYATQPMLPSNAPLMVLNSVFDYEINTNVTTENRYFEPAPSYLDGRQVEIRFERYTWATALNKYDEMVNYWNQPGGIVNIARSRMGLTITQTTDRLIRDAFLQTNRITLASSSATGADQLTSTDTFTLDMIDDAILRAQNENVWNSPAPGLAAGTLLCVGTPGQHYNIITGPTNSKWIELQKYASLKPFNQYEMGSYHSSRHVFSSINTLMNCGAISHQSNMTVAAGPLDGAPDPATTKVDNTYRVGQGNAAHSVTVANASGFNVGDIVTIHKVKNQAADVAASPKLRVLNGVSYNDGTAVDRRIVAKNGNTISFDRPLLKDFTTEINTSGTGAAASGSGVYGFVTKALSLHINLMLADTMGVICGVMVPPRIYAPRPIDLYESVYRMGWDAYWKFQLFKPEAFEVFVTAGPTRIAGNKFN